MTAGSPRFDFVYGKSCDFILSMGISSLPVNPLKLISLNHWGLVTYSKLCSLVPGGAKIDDIAESCRSRDGFTVCSGGNYCIAYNDTVRVKSRIAFTLMHEIGHIVCSHFDGQTTALASGKYRIFETEANCFASNVLAPACVITACGFKTAESLQAACGLSFNAATLRLSEIKSWQPRPVDEMIKHAFETYIRICTRRCSPKQADVEFDGAVPL